MNSSAAKASAGSRLRLRYATLSPFARKVLVAAHETKTLSELDLVKADVWANPDDVVNDNPLVKIPALRTPHGILTNSALICEYLDQLNGASILYPSQVDIRWKMLSAHAIADGVMEAAVAHVVELIRRPQDRQWEGWTDRQLGKIDRGLGYLESVCPSDWTKKDLFTITLGCTLEYIDFRIPTYDWRTTRPQLADWLKQFGSHPSMIATRPTI